MRDFLEDADKHRDDGYGRAQSTTRELPRRFYATAGIRASDGGFAVTLDDRPTKTPGGVGVVVPTEALAQAVAAEWAAQGDLIDPETMPIQRLVNSALESGDERIPAFRDEVVKYASSDLLLYRADSPRELVAEQERMWDAALVKLARHFGVSFQPTIGITHQAQPPTTLARVADALADEALLPVAALVSITGITGSGLLALALRHRLVDAEEAWLAAHVDEDYNIRFWGEVSEAMERRARRRTEYDAALKVLELLPRA